MITQDPKKKSTVSLDYFFRTRRFLGITIVLSGITMVVFFTLLFPRVQSIQSTQQSLAKEREILADNQKKLAILQNVESIDVFAQKDRINSLLPSNKPILPLLRRLETLSRQTNVIVSEFGLSPGEISTQSGQVNASSRSSSSSSRSTPTTNTQSVETKLVVSGKIGDVNTFLRGLNKISPLTSVSALSLKRTNIRSGASTTTDVFEEAVFEVTLTLQTFYFSGKATSKASASLPDIQEIGQDVINQIESYTPPEMIQAVQAVPVDGGGKENLFE